MGASKLARYSARRPDGVRKMRPTKEKVLLVRSRVTPIGFGNIEPEANASQTHDTQDQDHLRGCQSSSSPGPRQSPGGVRVDGVGVDAPVVAVAGRA